VSDRDLVTGLLDFNVLEAHEARRFNMHDQLAFNVVFLTFLTGALH